MVTHRTANHLLDPRNVRGEGRDDDPPGCLAEHLLEGFVDNTLRGRVARPFGVGAVGQQHQYSTSAIFCQGAIIGQAAIHGCIVKLVLAGVYDQAIGSLDGQANRVGYAVADVKGLHRKGADRYPISGQDGVNGSRV